MKKKYNIYLDDVRTPIEGDWVVVRTYSEIVKKITELGLENIDFMSLDHDLGEGAMIEFYDSVRNRSGVINYDNINEKTGYDVVKKLVNISLDSGVPLPLIQVHSFNPVGSKNMVTYINNYLNHCGLPQTCKVGQVKFKLEKPYPGHKNDKDENNK